MKYVYELRDTNGNVIDVGITKDPDRRMFEHISRKPTKYASIGKYYGRKDLTMHLVTDLIPVSKAMSIEDNLKKEYGIERTEKIAQVKGGKTAGKLKRVLSDNDVREIRRLCSNGMYQRACAKKYNVSQRTINKIVNKISYAEIV